MKNSMTRPAPRRALALTLLLLLLLPAPAPGGENANAMNRIDDLVESLNAVSDRQTRALERIYNELRGPDGRQMREALASALFRSNILIVQGAAEALAMLGDVRDAANLETVLAVNDRLGVKTRVIRLLPAFCLSGSERARFNYIRYAAGYERTAQPSVLAPLRRPPITRRGQLNVGQERLRSRIVLALVGQFDPIGAALRYVDDRLYGAAARNTVNHFVGAALGNDPFRWARIWSAQGDAIVNLEPAEMEEISLAILASLSDMGAEATPEAREAFRRLLARNENILTQAVFDSMKNMCAVAYADFPGLTALRPEADGAIELENWRTRVFASAAALAILAATEGGDRLEQAKGDEIVFAAAAACMGVALAFPEGFPDPDGKLAALRQTEVERLARLLYMPDFSLEKRSVLASALGSVGTDRAVSALIGILDSPYASPESGREGMLLAEIIVDALRTAAAGEREGKNAARTKLLELLLDERIYPPIRTGTPPIGLAHLVLWRLQRLAKATETSLEPGFWRSRLGW